MNHILEILLVATLFICVGCASLWASFTTLAKPVFHIPDLQHDTDPLPDLDHDHTLAAARCLGACGFVLLSMLFPKVFIWTASSRQLPDDASLPAGPSAPPDNASTAMLQQIAVLLTQLEERSAALESPPPDIARVDSPATQPHILPPPPPSKQPPPRML